MPGAKCRVKHIRSKEMPGAQRRMQEHGGLPALPQAPDPHASATSPWAPKKFDSGRNSPLPIEPPTRMVPAPGICPHGAKPSAETRATNRGGVRASDHAYPEEAVAKRSPVDSARHNAHELSVKLHTFRRQETQHLKANAAYAKKNPKSVPLWFFEKYKVITNS